MSKLTGVFEMHIHFKMIILKQEQIFKLHVQFEVMKLQLNIQINYKIFCFQLFPKDKGVFRTQSSIKMMPFVKIVNSLMLLTIFRKSSILDVSLVSKNATKSIIQASVSFTFLASAAIFN